MKKNNIIFSIPLLVLSLNTFANDEIPAPEVQITEQNANLQIKQEYNHEEREKEDAQLFVDILSSTQTFSASFEQITVSNTRASHEMTLGSLKLKKPSKFVWTTSAPFETYEISNGKKLWKYDVDLEEVDISYIDERNSQMMSLLESDKPEDLLESYEISADRYSTETVFTFVPKDNNIDVSSIFISFVDNQLNSVRIQTDLEQATLIDFTDVVINEEIKDSEFEFVIPNNVDVYDNTLFN